MIVGFRFGRSLPDTARHESWHGETTPAGMRFKGAPMSGWLPIGCAPRDSGLIWLREGGFPAEAGRWNGERWTGVRDPDKWLPYLACFELIDPWMDWIGDNHHPYWGLAPSWPYPCRRHWEGT